MPAIIFRVLYMKVHGCARQPNPSRSTFGRAGVRSRFAHAVTSLRLATIRSRSAASSLFPFGALPCFCSIPCGASIVATCGVKVEALPWANGKHTLTRAYMIFLAQWARKLSWKETALSFRTSWEKVFNAVEWVVEWGLNHRELGTVSAFGVDEIQYGRGHKYLTLVYQIEAGCTRLLWVGQERTKESFAKFFAMIGQQLCEKVEFVCSDMWKPYLEMIASLPQRAEYSRSLSHRREDEQGDRRSSCRRGPAHDS